MHVLVAHQLFIYKRSVTRSKHHLIERDGIKKWEKMHLNCTAAAAPADII